MAWFGDGLSSLSNLKGQITNFTKEVLSDGIVEEIDERTAALNEANERCVKLQEILTSKDAEISILRRQNGELQKVVVELNARNASQSEDGDRHGEGSAFFWDPPSIRQQDSKRENQVQLLREQLSQATARIRELESELKHAKLINGQHSRDDVGENHQRTELLRAKQDTINRIIQMGEKSREAERNMKRLQLDEAVLVNDFRTIISKLGSSEQLELLRAALKSLETENEKDLENGKEGSKTGGGRRFDSTEGIKLFEDGQFETVCLKADNEARNERREDKFKEMTSNKELELQRRIDQLEEENANLNANIVELDEQQVESIEKLLSIKEEMQKKHETLQKAYEQLYAEYNESQSKLETTETKLKLVEATNKKETASRPKDHNEAAVDLSKENAVVVDELTKRVKEILRKESIEIDDDDDTIFEAVARRYVEAKWKKEMLERKLTETTRELNQVSDAKESMQMECDDMQLNIESLLSEIQQLKSNLPSIPEAGEERVATLETEAETLQEDMRRLNSENESLRQENTELANSLRSKENLEAELKNTKQQLEVARQQLAGASKNVENNESMLEDLSQQLHSSLDENNQLRKRIGEGTESERRVEERLESVLKKCEKLEKDVESLETTRQELEIARNAAKAATDRVEQLETELRKCLDARNEIDQELQYILEQNEDLKTEIRSLHEQEYLKYDLTSMRKQVDELLEESKGKEDRVAALLVENEKLSKENASLVDQLTASQDESLDNIDLLNTEMLLLEQKFNALQQEAAEKSSQLNDALKESSDAKEIQTRLETELGVSKALLDSLSSEKESLIESEAKAQAGLRETMEALRDAEEKLTMSQDQERRLETELLALRLEDEKLASATQDNQRLEQELSDAMTKLTIVERRCDELNKELQVANENKNSSSSYDVEAIESENKQLQLLVEERRCEAETLLVRIKELETKMEEYQRREEALVANGEEASSMARETINALSQLVREKDDEVEKLKRSSMEGSELSMVRKERDELIDRLQTKHNESVQYYQEIQRLTGVLNEQIGMNKKLIGEQEIIAVRAKEKEAELLWTQNELQVVRRRLQNFEESDHHGEVCSVVEHSVQIAQAGMLNEKCNALEAALIQEQSSNRMLQNQLTESQNKESAAAKELERLRTHLMEIEAIHTEEALVGEQRLKELEAKLLQAEERVKNSSTVYTSASIRANQQVETLQQQMTLIVQQRDDIQKKLAAAEDKVLVHSASLTNLQIVLEQFQRDKDRDIEAATDKIRRQLDDSYKKQNELSNEISNLKDQLTESRECLQAASRLSEELDKKTEKIEQLKQEVARLTNLVSTADERIQGANKSGEGKVDKTLVKNLLLGYLSSPSTDKSSVLRVLATVLDFNESERNRSGLNNPATGGGWFATLIGSGNSTTSRDEEASLSAAFVRFLESESKPKAQLPALPISTTPPPRRTHSRQHSSSSTQSTLLLSNVTLPTFPDFIPARNTGSILKEVLKDS